MKDIDVYALPNYQFPLIFYPSFEGDVITVSSPTLDFTVMDSTLYFMADDGLTGYELWKSDGTAEGTIQVKDINPGVDSASPVNLVAVGDSLYFSANDGVIGAELWRTDGAITELVKDINPILGAGSSPAVLMHNR